PSYNQNKPTRNQPLHLQVESGACGRRKLLAERTGARPIGEIIGLSSQYTFRSQPNSVEYSCEKTD
ncbi:hypothetical protein, partial [Bifidobacterium longum]|uniref:hypothetical protein n=1 Tax=Bifidobacterium longum TaxID=216816 RepID=UPI001F5892DA